MDKAKLIERMKRKFNSIVVGEIADESSYPLTPGRALTYLEAIDEVANPAYAGNQAVPTTALENDVLYSRAGAIMSNEMAPLMALLAFQESTFLAPLKAGTKITIKTEFADKYIKRGKFYVSLKAVSYDESGTALLENVYTACCSGAKEEAETAPSRPDPFDHKIDVAALQALGGAAAAKVTADVAENTRIEPRSKQMTVDMTKLFWGYPVARHYHNDIQLAKSIGFPGLLMGASQGNAILSEMCHSYFGESWFTSGRMAIKPLVSVHPPENLVAKGVVRKKEAEGDKTRVHLDIWLENEKAEAALVGIASCLVDG